MKRYQYAALDCIQLLTYNAAMDMDMTLDQALWDALAVSARERPAFVRPYFDPASQLEPMLAEMRLQTAEARQSFDKWVRRAHVIGEKLTEVLSQNAVNSGHITKLRWAAERIEEKCDENSKILEREMKRSDRLVREMRSFNGKSAKAFQAILNENFDLSRREIEDRLEFALLLRAMATRHDPDKKIVATASTPKEVEDFLLSVMHS